MFASVPQTINVFSMVVSTKSLFSLMQLTGSTVCRIRNVLSLLMAGSTWILTRDNSRDCVTSPNNCHPGLVNDGMRICAPFAANTFSQRKPLSMKHASSCSTTFKIPHFCFNSMSDTFPTQTLDMKVTVPLGAITTKHLIVLGCLQVDQVCLRSVKDVVI